MLSRRAALDCRQILLATNGSWRQSTAAVQPSPISVRHPTKLATEARRPLAAAIAAAASAALALVLTPASAYAAPGDPARQGGTTVQVVADLPAFTGQVRPLTANERRAMTGPVWRRGCPVPLSALRAIEARHVTFQGTATDGILVLHRAHAPRALRVLRALYEARFPIRRMHPIERYGGSDNRSIEADNTSGFNCRAVTGGTRWSEHAYGRALDINPIENPYVLNGRTSHPRSRPYLDRTRVRPGMAVTGSIAVTAFAAEGFRWGGLWTNPIDTQHFSTSGR